MITIGTGIGGEAAARPLAVHAKVPVTTLRSMIDSYPTFHRAVEDALNQL